MPRRPIMTDASFLGDIINHWYTAFEDISQMYTEILGEDAPPLDIRHVHAHYIITKHPIYKLPNDLGDYDEERIEEFRAEAERLNPLYKIATTADYSTIVNEMTGRDGDGEALLYHAMQEVYPVSGGLQGQSI